MKVIKGTHSIKLLQNAQGWYELSVHGEVLVTGNNLDSMLQEYECAYNRIYCVAMY